MRQIEQLIDKYCPDGAERKKVKDVIISLKTGLNPRDNFILNDTDADCYYITGKEIQNNKIQVSKKTDLIKRDIVKLINKRAELHSGVLLFASTGTGTVGRMAIVDNYSEDWNVSETLYIITPKSCISLKFLMYILYSNTSVSQYTPKISKGSVPHLKVCDLLNVLIPLPSLEIQKRIVKDLDKLTGMIDNLETELALRRRQFVHYRNEQLSLDGVEGVEWKYLGDVCKIKNGKDYKNLGIGDIPVWGTGGIMCYVDKFAYNKPSVLLPRKGSIDKIYYTESPFWNVDTLFYTIINTSIILPKFLYYYLLTVNLVSLDTSKGNRPSLTQTVLNNIEIPLPSLEIQKRIVKDLDKFSSLVENIESELSLRQKQYEYYREQLLNF